MTEKKWCNERQEEEEKEEGVPFIETLTFIVKFLVHINIFWKLITFQALF